MQETLMAYLPTIVVAAIVFGLAALVCWKLYRDHKASKGGSSCGGNCGGCPNSGFCHPPK